MFVFLWLMFEATVLALGANPCVTPDGLNGDCKPVNECQPLVERLSHRPLSSADVNFLKNSTCGFAGSSPKGCCPVGSPINQNSSTPIKADSFDFEAATSNLLPTTDECGLYNPYRTFGREHPDLYEFPWMVLLEYNVSDSKKRFYCGGALISKRYVLTAANCIVVAQKRKWEVISVRLGEYNLDTDPDCVDYGFGEECAEKSVNREVEKSLVHENFSLSESENDIALLRLKNEVEFSDFIQPLCLPMTNLELTRNYVGKKLFVAGWGLSGATPVNQIKLKDQILVRNSSECTKGLPRRVSLSENQLCASGEEGQMWCKGDGGGPLMAIGTDKTRKITRWYAIGVSSFGKARSCSLEVYTRVSKYVHWIVSHLEA